MGLEREVGKILKAIESLEEDVKELKDDVKSLVGAKNKAMGAGMFVGGIAGILSTGIIKLMGWS